MSLELLILPRFHARIPSRDPKYPLLAKECQPAGLSSSILSHLPLTAHHQKRRLLALRFHPSVTEAAEGAVEMPVMARQNVEVVKELVVAMGKESMMREPVEVKVKLPMGEMAEPVMPEAMAEAEMMPHDSMMAPAGPQDEVAGTPVMSHCLGRQHHCSRYETRHKYDKSDSSHLC